MFRVCFAKYTVEVVGDTLADLQHPEAGNFIAKLREQGEKGAAMWETPMGGDGGNIMATPLVPGAPLGKLIIGSTRPDFVYYWQSQGVQPVIEIDTTWLLVGHVDEIVMWVGADKVLYADPWVAADLMHEEIESGRGTNGLWFGFTLEGKTNTVMDVAVAKRPGGRVEVGAPSGAEVGRERGIGHDRVW